MIPERMSAEDLFAQALELSPDQRQAFLDSHCGGNPQLRAELESLLRWHEWADTRSWEIPSSPDPAAAPALAQIRARTLAFRRIGHFDLQEFLGEGATGIVYRALDTRNGHSVALKVASPHTMLNAENRERFERAAEAVMHLDHPRIARVLETGEVDELKYVVLEHIEGSTLADQLKTRKFDPAEALRIARQMAEALEAAHARGIIHRDLKPANIMLDRRGDVKVLDFGLCHAFTDAESIAKTKTGVVLGTLGYMAPEQAGGSRPQPQSDLFSFGAVVYEMLSGRPAFRGETPVAILSSVLADRPERLSPRSGLMDLALWCMEKDPARRPDSAARVLEEIANLEKGGASLALRARRVPARLPQVLIASGVLLLLAAGVRFALRSPRAGSGSADWVQLTRFTDPVSQPALSRDGRKLVFVRGPNTFAGNGQIYVKDLPDGDAVQITHDDLLKMSPAFSPDGSHIAYSTANRGNQWDTWIVPAAGGEPRKWLPNASGLVWFGQRNLLFSEIKDSNVHMGIVTSDENRGSARDVYLPENAGAMAHRSYPSPDQRWVILVEMDPKGTFLPCRLVPMDGRSPGRAIGPAGPCTFAAWSPDGNWMYVSSATAGTFHTWRQRFPDGRPEQVTAGPTEEAGIAMAPDGGSFITAVSLKQSAIWVHDAAGERQVSVEGYSYDPKFTPDGKKLCYRILRGSSAADDPSELEVLDLESGISKPLLPGLAVRGGQGRAYDISPDGLQAVAGVAGPQGKRLMLARIDGSSPPRQVPNLEGDQPLFDRNGDILAQGGQTPGLWRAHPNGEGLIRLSDEPMLPRGGVSPDGKYLAARVVRPAGYTTLLYSLDGGSPVELAPAGAVDYYLNWSADGRLVFLSISTSISSDRGRTYAVPLKPGSLLPELPRGGFRSEAQIAQLPGVQRIDSLDVAPGVESGTYAFARETLLRNLFRIRVP